MAAFPVPMRVQEEYEEAQVAATMAYRRARMLLVIAKRWHTLADYVCGGALAGARCSASPGRIAEEGPTFGGLFTQTEKLQWDEDAEALRSLERVLG